MAYSVKPLPFSKPLRGISERTLSLHHGRIYAGLVAQKNAIAEKLHNLLYGGTGQLAASDQYASALRALKAAERAVANAVMLHECYFAPLGGDGIPTGPLATALAEKYGTIDRALRYLSASALCTRRWAVLGFDAH
jgi:superoxide dismutase